MSQPPISRLTSTGHTLVLVATLPIEQSALERWRAELTAGKRSVDTTDELWRLACDEMQRIEHRADLRAWRGERMA